MGYKDIVFLLDVRIQQGHQLAGIIDGAVFLHFIEWAGTCAYREQTAHFLATGVMFSQHHSDRATILGKSGLDHLDKEPVFFFAVMAFVGEIAEEPAKVGHILASNQLPAANFSAIASTEASTPTINSCSCIIDSTHLFMPRR